MGCCSWRSPCGAWHMPAVDEGGVPLFLDRVLSCSVTGPRPASASISSLLSPSLGSCPAGLPLRLEDTSLGPTGGLGRGSASCPQLRG